MAPKSRRHGMPARHTKRVSAISIRPQFEQLESRIAPALFNVQNPMSFSGLNNNGCVVVSDFNKDGFTDAVLTNFGTDHGAGAAGTISVLYGNSSGGFNKIQLNTGGLNVSFASVGDINGDTWPDLVVSNGNQQNTGSVSVFRNDAEGNLIPQGTPFSAGGNNSAWVGLSDMTGDNILDVVVANFGREQAGQIVGNNVTIFQGNTDAQGKGNFAFTLTTTLAPEIQFVPTSLAIADFDADGIKDIAAVSPGIPPDFGQPYPPGTVYVFEGTGSGGYLAPNQFESGGALPVNVQAADLNGDGDQDLVIANAGDPLATPEWNNDGIGVLPNVSSGGTLLFGIPNSLTTNTHGPFAVAVSDFDVDGDQDIAAINYGSQLASPAAFVSVYLRGANGTYAPGSPGSYDTMTSVGGGQYLAVGNFNSDGTPDLIVAHASNLVGVLLNTSVPSISTTTTLQSSLNPSAAAESVTFTATVSASSTVTGGTVTFFDNGIPMGPAVNLTSQQAAFTTTTLTAGTHSITATYSGAAGFAASTSTAFSQVVNPGVAQTFTITGLPSITSAGTAFNVSVSARDQFGNVANGYRGIVHFTSTDAQAVLPSDYTFTAADNGAHTFTITLKTQGAQSLTVTDTVTNTITGTANTTVNAAAASVFTVTGFPTSTTAGVSQNLTVTAMDAFGNVAGGYRGTVHFTSSDPQATLPVDYTFTAADNGVHNFAAALKTAGVQTIIATDTTTGSITGTQAGITVNAAATSTFQVSAPAAAVTGTAFNVTVTAKDAFGNTATGYTGTVHFTSSDGQAVLPTDYTFTGGDAGSHTFSVTLNTAGSQTVTATDTVTGSITGSDAVTVSSSAATHFEVSAPPTATAGASFTVTVTALNSSNAIDTGYRGTVHFTSSDGQAILPANYTFTAGDAGSHTFTITLGTAGSQTVTATDTTTGSITGSDTIAASAGAATQFTVSAPSNATEGIAFNATVTAKDAFGNTATGYTGTVHFTSSDGQAILPANYTFTAGDAGSHTFTITLNTTGNQTITATDTVTGSITGNDIVAVGVLPPPPPTAQPFAVGTAKGPVASVTMYNPDRTVAFTVQPFGPNYRNGVRIAVGDVTGDGVPDVVAVTNGGIKAKARIIDGSTGTVLPNELLGATPYKGKVSVATGDVDGDGTADIALGLNSGGPRARLFKGGDFTKLTGLLAGPTAGFVGNTTVALGDMTGDGKADLVVSSLYSTGSRVAGFNGESLVPGATRQRLFTRLMLGGPYVSGLFLTVGDVNGDTRADLVIGSPGTRNPNVKVFSGKALVDDNARTKIATFTPGGSTKGGVRVAVRDINGDGTVDIITSSGEMVSAFQGGAGLPAIGLPPLMFTFDPNPAFIGSVWVG